MITGIVTFYSTVLFVHVMAVVIGFGAIFVYPILWRAARARDPRSLPYLFTVQSRVGQTVIGPATVLILLTGIYLVADGPYEMSASFISVALPILVALILMGPFYFGRTEDKLAELAERDIAASAGGEVTFSEEYESRFRQLQHVSRLASLAILVALFFMVVKP
jgi:uncharacterized membrane protein